MQKVKLVEELRAACNGAPSGDKVVTVHLFAIENADRLREENLHDLAERAGIGRSFGTELRKGLRLSTHVQLKQL